MQDCQPRGRERQSFKIIDVLVTGKLGDEN